MRALHGGITENDTPSPGVAYVQLSRCQSDRCSWGLQSVAYQDNHPHGAGRLTSRRTIFAVLFAMAFVAFVVILRVQWKAPPVVGPLFSTSPDELFQQGVQGIRDRNVGEIRSALGGLAPLADQSERVQLLRGALSLLSDDPQGALQHFAKLTPQGQNRDLLLTLTGETLYRVGQLDDAEHCLLLAIQETPDNVDAIRWLATVYYDLGDIEQTLRMLETVSRVAPLDYRPHHMQGAIYRDYGEHKKAIMALSKAVELAAGNEIQAELRPLLASSQMSLKQFDAAMVTLQECPTTTVTLSLRADCLWQKGQSAEAGQALAQAESLGELPAAGRRLKARVLLERNELHQSRQLLESLITTTPSDEESEYMLALLFRQLKDESQYQIHLKRSESMKSLKNSLTELSQKAMQEPTNAEVRDQLAGICDQLELKPLAQVWRTAAASCRRRQPPVVPPEKATP